jgi:hypothetical protein
VTATDQTPGAGPAEAEEFDALDLARNAAHNVRVFAEAQDRDPLTSHLQRYGDRGFAAAQLGACMAAVSAAEDIRRMADAVIVMALDVRRAVEALTATAAAGEAGEGT